MKKLYDGVQRFCAAHPRFGIPNLMRVIVIGNVAVYVLMLLTQANDANALSFLTFNLNALLFNYFSFFCNDFSWKTICRNSISHHTTNCWKSFFQCYVMSLFSQIICCCQTCRTCSYNTYFLACICKLFSFAFPVSACIMLCCITFDVTDSHWITDFFSLTL